MFVEAFVALAFVLISLTDSRAVDLNNTEIYVVNNDSRFTSLHPDINLVAFNKVHHVKGNYVFSAGEQISGTHLILNFMDETQFTKGEDIEVLLKYPAKTIDGAVITLVEIFVDLTSKDADAFFVDGGIDKTYAEILLVCNQTQKYSYEIFMYGY